MSNIILYICMYLYRYKIPVLGDVLLYTCMVPELHLGKTNKTLACCIFPAAAQNLIVGRETKDC